MARFMRRWIIEPVMAQLTQGITPDRLALSIAAGSYCAAFPILGAATPLCVAVGVLLRLNQPVVQGVNVVTSPAYVPLVIAFVRLGDRLRGTGGATLDFRGLLPLVRHDPGHFWPLFRQIAGHAVLGWAALGPLWIGIGYLSLRPVLRAAAAAPAFAARGVPVVRPKPAAE